jgi:hypothetical protein
MGPDRNGFDDACSSPAIPADESPTVSAQQEAFSWPEVSPLLSRCRLGSPLLRTTAYQADTLTWYSLGTPNGSGWKS